MRKIIAITSFFMMLGQAGNLELGQDVNIFKLLTLLAIFGLAIKKYIK